MKGEVESSERDTHVWSMFYKAVKRCEEHAKQVGELFEDTRKIFQKDHSGTAAAVGALTIGGSLAVAFWGVAAPIVGVGIVTGGVVFVAGLVSQHFVAQARLRNVQTLLQLEQEKARTLQQAAIFDHIADRGLPKGTKLEDIVLLLTGNVARSTSILAVPDRVSGPPGENEVNN